MLPERRVEWFDESSRQLGFDGARWSAALEARSPFAAAGCETSCRPPLYLPSLDDAAVDQTVPVDGPRNDTIIVHVQREHEHTGRQHACSVFEGDKRLTW